MQVRMHKNATTWTGYDLLLINSGSIYNFLSLYPIIDKHVCAYCDTYSRSGRRKPIHVNSNHETQSLTWSSWVWRQPIWSNSQWNIPFEGTTQHFISSLILPYDLILVNIQYDVTLYINIDPIISCFMQSCYLMYHVIMSSYTSYHHIYYVITSSHASSHHVMHIIMLSHASCHASCYIM